MYLVYKKDIAIFFGICTVIITYNRYLKKLIITHYEYLKIY